jgi:hypothetical protein
MTHDIRAELATILEEILPPGEASGGGPLDRAFRHRQHVHLAFIAACRYGAPQAADTISGWIRHLTAHAPQKYHATITLAWTEIVGHHVAADPSVTDFDVFAERNQALFDKRLLSRHYTSALLASSQARAGWVEPDIAAFPWSSRP